MTSRPTVENWLSIFALGLVWGGAFMAVSMALAGHGPLTVAAARTGLGAVATLGLMAAFGRRFPRDRRFWSFALPIGVLNSALPFFLLSWGQQYVPSAFAGLSMAALPLFVLPLAHVFADEPMSGWKAAGVTIGFAGALVLLGPGLTGFAASREIVLGQIACLIAAFSYAVSSVMTRSCPPVDAITLSGATLGVGALVLIPAMLWAEGVPRLAGGLPDYALIFLGLVPTALAALIRVRVIQTAGAVFMTLVNYQVPVWSMMLGALVLGETLPLRLFAALALILGGLAISQWPGLRMVRRRV